MDHLVAPDPLVRLEGPDHQDSLVEVVFVEKLVRLEQLEQVAHRDHVD